MTEKEKTIDASDVKQKEKNENRTNRRKTTKETRQEKSTKDKSVELKQTIGELKAENEKIKDQLLRKMAEFDNYKRRTEKEFIENIQSASRELIEELLPVIDDFERSIQHAEQENEKSDLLQGVKLVYKNLMKSLTKRGLEVLEAVGKEFSPDEHDALMQIDTDKYKSGFVVEEHLKGYKMNDKVIRHAQVLVSK